MADFPQIKIKKRKKMIQRYAVEAIYVGDEIDLKLLRNELKQYQFLNRDYPLIIKISPDKYIALTKFGIIVFWNIGERIKKDLLKVFSPYIKSSKYYKIGDFFEKIKIIIGGEVDKVLFSKILINHLYFEKIKVISSVLAQSVALERYEYAVGQFFSTFETIVKKLKESGKIKISSKKILQYIGDALEIKQAAISKIALLDKPSEVWESQELENLYNELYFYFELPDRIDIFNEKINFLSEGTKMMADFLERKTAHLLELIIILLITIELIPYLPNLLDILKLIF